MNDEELTETIRASKAKLEAERETISDAADTLAEWHDRFSMASKRHQMIRHRCRNAEQLLRELLQLEAER